MAALAAVAVAALLQALALPGPYLGFEHDDAVYVLAARSLVDEGAYRFATLPGFPPIRLFPPGLPVLLAPWAWAFPDRPGVFALAAWTWLIAADALAWVWLTRRLGARAGAAAFAFFAVHPLVVARAGVVMPEVPFLALSLAFVLLAERGVTAARSGWTVAAAWLVRPAAVALLPALAAAPVLRRDWRQAALALLPVAGCWAAWTAWTSGNVAEVQELATTGPRTLGLALLGVLQSAFYYAAVTGGSFWPAFLPGAPLAGAALLVLAFSGSWRALKADPAEPGALVLWGLAAMHLAWPWRYERYLVPALPFIAVYAALGLRALAPAARRKAEPAAVLFAALALAQAVFHAWPWVAAPPVPSKPPLERTYAWIAGHVPPEGVVASVYWARDTVHTGRSFVAVPEARDAAELEARLREHRAGWVLWTDVSRAGLPPAVLASLDRLDALLKDRPAVFAEPREGARVLRVGGGM